MSNDCTLCFRASCIFGIVWFVCLTIGMLSPVQLLLHPNLTRTDCIHYIYRLPVLSGSSNTGLSSCMVNEKLYSNSTAHEDGTGL